MQRSSICWMLRLKVSPKKTPSIMLTVKKDRAMKVLREEGLRQQLWGKTLIMRDGWHVAIREEVATTAKRNEFVIVALERNTVMTMTRGKTAICNEGRGKGMLL